MSQVARHPAYLQVEDLLDAIGQRYRVFVLARGCILLSALVVGATVVAALLAGGLVRFKPEPEMRRCVSEFVSSCQERGRRLALIALVLHKVHTR